MSFERFIANRLSLTTMGNFSALILRIAVLSIALSVAVMIITTTVIKGFKEGVTSKVLDFWGHIHITDGNVGETFELIPIDLDPSLVADIEAIEQITYQRPPTIIRPEIKPPVQTTSGGVDRVETYTIVPAILSTKSDFEGVYLKGYESDYQFERIKSYMKRGSWVSYPADGPAQEIVLSEQISKRMNFDVGDKMIIYFILDGEQYKKRFTVSGIYKTGLEEYDRRFALVDTRVLQEVLDWRADQVSGLEVYVDNLDDAVLLNEYIYFEKLPRNLYSQSIQSKFYQIFQWLELQDINEHVLILLMILVAVINMITAVLIFVLERTEMIGLLKSVGASDWSIRKIFLHNAAEVVIKGMIIGNVLALALCFLQLKTGVFKLSEAEYYLDTVPISFDWWMILLINIGTVLVTLLFMIIPTWIVSRVDPVKALRFS